MSHIVNFALQSENPSVNAVDHMLCTMTLGELTGKHKHHTEELGLPPLEDPKPGNPMFGPGFDTFAYATSTWHRVIHDQIDPQEVVPYLGRRPLEVVKQTLKHTTQLAEMIIRSPMTHHWKARSLFARVKHLEEGMSTDPIFVNIPSLFHGFLGCQVFLGLTSKKIDVHGFKEHRNFAQIYKDQIRKEGAPSLLRRDNGERTAE